MPGLTLRPVERFEEFSLFYKLKKPWSLPHIYFLDSFLDTNSHFYLVLQQVGVLIHWGLDVKFFMLH